MKINWYNQNMHKVVFGENNIRETFPGQVFSSSFVRDSYGKPWSAILTNNSPTRDWWVIKLRCDEAENGFFEEQVFHATYGSVESAVIMAEVLLNELSD